MSSLTHIVNWCQQLVCEVLQPGDLAVDLTAGKGRDTLALSRAVGPAGQVVAFDIQSSALDQTEECLSRQGLASQRWPAGEVVPDQSGVYLLQTCHTGLSNHVCRPARAVIANLGYLPGGDQSLVTLPATTLAALQQVLELLAPGGRLAVTIYPGHPGGVEEAEAVTGLLTSLDTLVWSVLNLNVANQPQAPRLYVVERSRSRL